MDDSELRDALERAAKLVDRPGAGSGDDAAGGAPVYSPKVEQKLPKSACSREAESFAQPSSPVGTPREIQQWTSTPRSCTGTPASGGKRQRPMRDPQILQSRAGSTPKPAYKPILASPGATGKPRPKSSGPRQPRGDSFYTARFHHARAGTARVYSDVSVADLHHGHPVSYAGAQRPQDPSEAEREDYGSEPAQELVHVVARPISAGASPNSMPGTAGCSIACMHLLPQTSPLESQKAPVNRRPVRQRLGY